MDLKTLTFIVVGSTFALYIAIAIYSRAKTLGISMLQARVFTR